MLGIDMGGNNKSSDINNRLKGKALRREQMKALERTGAKHYDGFMCQNCGAWVDGLRPPHHKEFKSRGGSDKAKNLDGLCQICHDEKHGIRSV